ncbi:MAG: MerR family transcriptional regulator [Actinocatenispora sp.]
MSIGEVLAHLRADFPDTTISKLRFLESEGLVDPERTPSGYRKYSWDDVARLTYILTAQRDQYLPLRVIRDHLSALDEGLVPAGGAVVARPPLVAVEELPSAQDFDSGVDVRLSRAEFAEHVGVSDAQLRDLEQYGLVSARPGGWYDTDAVEIARVVGQLAEFGVEPRHLRSYRSAADREIGLFEQVVAPLARQRNPEARARAAETVRELAALSLRLHAALVQAGLRG